MVAAETLLDQGRRAKLASPRHRRLAQAAASGSSLCPGAFGANGCVSPGLGFRGPGSPSVASKGMCCFWRGGALFRGIASDGRGSRRWFTTMGHVSDKSSGTPGPVCRTACRLASWRVACSCWTDVQDGQGGRSRVAIFRSPCPVSPGAGASGQIAVPRLSRTRLESLGFGWPFIADTSRGLLLSAPHRRTHGPASSPADVRWG